VTLDGGNRVVAVTAGGGRHHTVPS
jgi:hypothetical protein